MKRIDCFIPFAGKEQAERTIKGLQNTGLVNNIYLLADSDVTENVEGCKLLPI